MVASICNQLFTNTTRLTYEFCQQWFMTAIDHCVELIVVPKDHKWVLNKLKKFIPTFLGGAEKSKTNFKENHNIKYNENPNLLKDGECRKLIYKMSYSYADLEQKVMAVLNQNEKLILIIIFFIITFFGIASYILTQSYLRKLWRKKKNETLQKNYQEEHLKELEQKSFNLQKYEVSRLRCLPPEFIGKIYEIRVYRAQILANIFKNLGVKAIDNFKCSDFEILEKDSNTHFDMSGSSALVNLKYEIGSVPSTARLNDNSSSMTNSSSTLDENNRQRLSKKQSRIPRPLSVHHPCSTDCFSSSDHSSVQSGTIFKHRHLKKALKGYSSPDATTRNRLPKTRNVCMCRLKIRSMGKSVRITKV